MGIIQGLNFKIILLICEIIFVAKNVGAEFHIFPNRVYGLYPYTKKYYRYIKIIFSKKILITFVISAIIFNTYTLLLNNQYENFYKKVEEEVKLEAVVISNKKISKYYNSYIIKGKIGEFKNKKFILYVKNNEGLEYGDRIEIIGKFNIPEDSRNYKGFSYKKYLQTEKIYGTINLDKLEVKSKNNTTFIFKLSNSARNKIIEQIKNILPEEIAGVLIGLMLGEKTYISDELILDFQKSSLAHILAVSGAHVSYIILGLSIIISINKMPKKCGYIFIICTLIVFIFITKFSVSVIRACTMSIILIISKLLYRKADIKNTIAISILIILIYNPYSIRSVSMQLSYLGTIGVIFVAPVLSKAIEKVLKGKLKNKTNKKIAEIVSVPIAAQITILPIMIKNFSTISFTFLISNLIAMPLLGISIIGGYLITIFSFIWLWGAKQIGTLFHIILKVLIIIANLCGNLKLSNIYVIIPNTITIIIYYIVVIGITYILFLKFSIKLDKHEKKIFKFIQKINYKKVLVIIVAILIITEIPYSNYNGKLKIYFLDVGQRR